VVFLSCLIYEVLFNSYTFIFDNRIGIFLKRYQKDSYTDFIYQMIKFNFTLTIMTIKNIILLKIYKHTSKYRLRIDGTNKKDSDFSKNKSKMKIFHNILFLKKCLIHVLFELISFKKLFLFQ